MRKIWMASAAVLAAGLVAGCGGTDEPGETASVPPAETAAPGDTDTDTDTDTDVAGAADTDVDVASAPEADADVTGSVQFADFPAPYASADYDRGRRIFLQCQSCHTINEGGPAVLGPNLHGLFGREVGTAGGFDFSDALQEADFEWTPEQLDDWLTRPRDFLPGNKMNFAGVTRPDDRTAVIAYIMAESGYAPD